MRDHHIFAFLLTTLIAGRTAAAAGEVASPLWPKENDTLAASELPAAQIRELLEQVEATSFDTPESWLVELRARIVASGRARSIIVRGTSLLCGGTGNCQIWLFRYDKGHWINLIEGEAPMVDSLKLTQGANQDMPDLIAGTNTSSTSDRYSVYVFHDKTYRRVKCYETTVGASKEVACE